MLGLNARLLPRSEEALEALVSETPDHAAEFGLWRYVWQARDGPTGTGLWTDYGREICRRVMAIIEHDLG
jgi:hypothetical protein